MFGIHIVTDVIKIPACDLQYLNSTTTGSTTTATVIPGTVNNAKHTNHNDSNGGDTTTVRTKVVTKKSLLPIIHREIDILYPNRVLIDIGLVISRYYYHGRFNHTSSSSATDTNHAPTELKFQGDNIMTSKKRKRPPATSSSSSSIWKVPKKQELLYMGTKLLQNGGTCDSYGTSSSSNGGCGVHYKVQFPVIVFRPYVGEVLYGTICDMNQNGIIVTLGNFFAAIYIPTIYMLHPSSYVHAVSTTTSKDTNSSDKGIWVWSPTYDDDDDDENNKNSNDDDNEPLRYEMNIGDEIRVRVKSIHYSKPESTTISTKNGKPISSSNTIESGNNTTGINHPTKRPRSSSVTTTAMNHTIEQQQQQSPLQHCAMYIIASICEDGLGLTSWWKNEIEEDENDDNDDDDDEE